MRLGVLGRMRDLQREQRPFFRLESQRNELAVLGSVHRLRFSELQDGKARRKCVFNPQTSPQHSNQRTRMGAVLGIPLVGVIGSLGMSATSACISGLACFCTAQAASSMTK